MKRLRTHIRQNRWLAVWLVMAALCMKVLVPAGFMPVMSGGTMTVIVCSGVMRQAVTVAIPGKVADKPELPCAFGGLGTPGLAATDPILLAIAIAFVMATGFAALSLPVPAGSRHLWPPLRGPPAIG